MHGNGETGSVEGPRAAAGSQRRASAPGRIRVEGATARRLRSVDVDREQQEAIALLEDDTASFVKQYGAARLVAEDVGTGRIETVDVPRFYRAQVSFWKSLGLRPADRDNAILFSLRKKLAWSCATLSRRLAGGRKFFDYYPRLSNVEGPHDLGKNEILRGALTTTYGSSLYEFHWEYPIRGFGVRKDLIAVITDDDARVPLFDWCRENDLIVFCNRCGLEITYEVSKDCPWRTGRRTVH